MAFGGLRGRGVAKQDPPIERDLYLSLEDLFYGCTKKIKISRRVRPGCRGTWARGLWAALGFCRLCIGGWMSSVSPPCAPHVGRGLPAIPCTDCI